MKLFFKYLLLLDLLIPLLCLKRGVFKSEFKNRPKSTIKLDTNLGTIIGYKQNVNIPNIVNKTINVFYAVPFSDGKPKRFRKAKLINKFPNHTYYATEFKPHCPRIKLNKYHQQDKYTEDCLYLNIWTPDIQKINETCTKEYTVIVTIVGQESVFIMSIFPDHNGNGELGYNPTLLTALHDIIVITINNRQEIFNSLYLDGVFSGNLMLFDQNLALKWVKKNIKDYCGNDKITLIGNSLSSKSVQAHLLSSKYSKNLIDHAILQSHSLFEPLNMANRNESMINSMLIINELGCLNTKLKDYLQNYKYLKSLGKNIIDKYFNYNSELNLKEYLSDLNLNWNKIKFSDKRPKLDEDVIKLTKFLSRYAVDLKCLEDIEMNEIMNINPKYTEISYFFYFDDDDFFDKDIYLNYKLLNQLNINSNVSILQGGLLDESCEIGIYLKDNFYNDKFNIIVPKNDTQKIIKNSFIDIFEDKEMADYIANYYTDLNKHELKRGFYDAISNYENDLIYNCPLYFHSEFYAKSSKKTFNYIIDYKFVYHLMESVANYSMNRFTWMDSCHADEIIHFYSHPFTSIDFFTDLDRKFSLKLMELWALFARDGEMPNLEPDNKKWPFSNKNNTKPKFVQIGHSYTREHKFDFEKRCNEIWRSILNHKKCGLNLKKILMGNNDSKNLSNLLENINPHSL